MTFDMTLGEQLAALRKARGLTQAKVARAVGLTGNAVISRLERGTLLPSSALQEKLGRLFGLSPAVLRDRVDAEATGAREQSLLDAIDAEAERVRAALRSEGDALVGELTNARARLAETLLASRVQLLWSREQKIAHEAAARSVWVVSPDLELDVAHGPLRAVVEANLERGASYRYLVPHVPAVLARAKQLLARAPTGSDLQVRASPAGAWHFVLEVVLYDAQAPKRRLGLMVAPSSRAETDCVLGPLHARRFTQSFLSSFRAARPVGGTGRSVSSAGQGPATRRPH